MVAGDVAVIPGNVEHEGIFPEDTEVVDIFAPPREDFLAGGAGLYAQLVVWNELRVRACNGLVASRHLPGRGIYGHRPKRNGCERTLVRIDFGLSAVPRIW